jgi:hypothetical protein
MLKAARDKVLAMAAEVEKHEPEHPPDEEDPNQPQPPPKRISRREEAGIVKRLSNAPRRFTGPIITDFDLWKKKHKLTPEDRVFIISGGYPILRKALLSRGWYENKEKDSPCFDLKWSLKCKDIDFKNLQEFQVVNHFNHGHELTTKIGISRNLKNLVWYTNVDIDTFFPRSFDCNEEDDL